MTVVTRFAPSPTGFLHIGGARTALFNWLFAKHHGGKYLLRIEDTDKSRSTDAAIEAIKDGLNWLGLDYDGEICFQSKNAARHMEVAKELLKSGKAYHCYCSPDELTEMRVTAKEKGLPMRYNGKWRDMDEKDAPQDISPVIRIKIPQNGATTIDDKVQGSVTVNNSELDDYILLRADGTPTYMLSVVVDDHDMKVSHIIRGDDHLTNAFRQYHLYKAMGWNIPEFAHIPLIHGADGAKLSKRHGALGVDSYRDQMGYLPEAICNYLMRLGWSHGDAEIISREQAIEWFDLDAIGKSASKFDFAKLENLNGNYIREADNYRLCELIIPKIDGKIDEVIKTRLVQGIESLKERAKNINDLAISAEFYVNRPSFPLKITKAAKLLNATSITLLGQFAILLKDNNDWSEEILKATIHDFINDKEIGFGKIASPLRAALTGTNISPSITDVMVTLGKQECLTRISAVPK